MKRLSTCDHCGKDRGQDGCMTVLLARNQAGVIESIPVTQCRECALKQGKEEASDGK